MSSSFCVLLDNQTASVFASRGHQEHFNSSCSTTASLYQALFDRNRESEKIARHGFTCLYVSCMMLVSLNVMEGLNLPLEPQPTPGMHIVTPNSEHTRNAIMGKRH